MSTVAHRSCGRLSYFPTCSLRPKATEPSRSGPGDSDMPARPSFPAQPSSLRLDMAALQPRTTPSRTEERWQRGLGREHPGKGALRGARRGAVGCSWGPGREADRTPSAGLAALLLRMRGQLSEGREGGFMGQGEGRAQGQGEGPREERCRPDSELLDSQQTPCPQTGPGGTAAPPGMRAHTDPAWSASPTCW